MAKRIHLEKRERYNDGRESSVNEVFPIVAGVLSALLVWKYVPVPFRTFALGACGLSSVRLLP